MTQILILNFTSRLNKGAAALLNSKIKLLSYFFVDAKFVVSTYNPKIEYNQFDVKLLPVHGKFLPPAIILIQIMLSTFCTFRHLLKKYFNKDINLNIRGKSIKQYCILKDSKSRLQEIQHVFNSLYLLLKCAIWAILTKIGLTIDQSFCGSKLQEYYDADIVLNTGGDVLTEDYNFPFSFFVNLLFGILLGKPVIICAESIGPFKKKWTRYIAKYVLNHVTLITLREEISLQYLQEIGVNNPPTYITADLAFLLEPPSNNIIKELLKRECINADRTLVGYSVSKIISRYGFLEFSTSTEKYNEYVKLMSQSMDYIIEKLNAIVVIVPHVIGPGDIDDRSVADDICKQIKNKDKIVSIKEDYTPEELKGIIGQCDLFIGSRMHATIASTSTLVPTIGIAYSHKMNGIVGKMLGQEKYILDVKYLDYESLILTINDVWKNRDVIREELKIKIPIAKEKAMLNGKLIRELVDSL